MTLVGALVLVVAGFCVGTAEPAAACTCMPGSEAEHLANADAVFLGRVTAFDDPSTGPVVSSGRSVTWTFAVETVFKGDVAEEQPIVSAADGGSCGLEVTSGGYYLVFASEPERYWGAPAPEGLAAGLCGGTRPATPGEEPRGFPPGAPAPAAPATPADPDRGDTVPAAQSGPTTTVAARGPAAPDRTDEGDRGLSWPAMAGAGAVVLAAGVLAVVQRKRRA